jgi:hypothetical protein
MPQRKPERNGDARVGVWLFLLPLVCCGLPLLIGVGAIGVVGSWLHSWWLALVAVLLVVAAIGWHIRRRRSGTSRAD